MFCLGQLGDESTMLRAKPEIQDVCRPGSALATWELLNPVFHARNCHCQKGRQLFDLAYF